VSTRVLIADDEAPARRKLRTHLARAQGVEVAGEAADGLATVEAIRTLRPDLVFLDIQMPGLTGFEVVEAIGCESMPAVVFVTAYDEFALEAFDVQAVDYLLKPFSEERFQRALDRARKRIAEASAGSAESERLARLLAATRPGSRHLQRLVVKKAERLYFVPVAEVLRFTAEGNYVRIQAAAGSHLVRDTLTSLEARLDPDRFARIHRSEIVAIDAIQEIQPWFHGDYIVILKNGERLRMSRRYQGRLLEESGQG
jgi:two-component system LytT family response regulator